MCVVCRCVCVCDVATSIDRRVATARRVARTESESRSILLSSLSRLRPLPPLPSYLLLQLISLPPAAFLLSSSSRNTSISFLILLRFFHAFLSYISSFFICLFFVLFNVITLLSCVFDEIYLFLRDVMHITVHFIHLSRKKGS